MWHHLITHNSLERTRGISQITSRAEVEGEENGKENVKVGETKYEESFVDGGGKEECLVVSACGQSVVFIYLVSCAEASP